MVYRYTKRLKNATFDKKSLLKGKKKPLYKYINQYISILQYAYYQCFIFYTTFLYSIFACLCFKRAIQALLHLLRVRPHGLRLNAIQTDHNLDYPI